MVVVEQRSNDASINYFISGDNPSGTNTLLMLGYKFNNTITFGQFSNNYQFTVSSFSSPKPKIHIFRFSSSLGKNYYLNGIAQTPSSVAGASPTQGLTSYTNAQIGDYLGVNYYAGYIGEIIIFNKYINDTERQDIESYLSKKWSINLK